MFIFHPQGNENRQCPLCNKLFPNPAEYTLHLKQHTDGTKCLVCGKVLSSANSLDRHLLVHSGEKPFECQHCGKAFTTNGNMNRHMKKRKHPNGSESDSLAKRAKRVHINSETSNPPPVITSKSILQNCDHCTNGFRNLVKTGLKPENFELISRMDCERRRTCPCNAKESSKSPDDVEPPQVCDHCGDICLRMSNRHQNSPNNSLFLCTTCNSGFISMKKFQFHKLNHKTSDQKRINIDMRKEEDKISFLQTLGLFSKEEVKNIKEDDSSKELNNTKEVDNISERDEIRDEPTKLENTILESSSNHPSYNNSQDTNASVVSLSSNQTLNVKSPLAADCASPGSSTVQAPASPVEGSIVAVDNELQCKECGEIFDTKKLQTMHYFQVHLKKSSFPCPQCDYVSKDKSTLTRHMRKHTGEKPYMCIICFSKFTTETNAKRHIKNKHNIFSKLKKHIECKSSEKSNADQGNTKCHYCRKDFGDSKLLTQHINAPDCPGKPFICSKCPMRFPTKNNCLRHMQHIHKLEKDQARESMIIDRFIPSNENEEDRNLERIEMILDAADSEIAHTESFTDEESIQEEDMVEENQNCTSDKENAPVVIEMELNDVAIDMSKNSSRMTNETLSAPLNIDTVRHRPSSTEVDVSYSMLRLSEEPYPQEQENALDLSIRPIDLTAKIEKNNQNNQKHSDTEHSDMVSHPIVPPPAHTLSSPAISKQSSHLNFLSYLSIIQSYPVSPVPRPQRETDIFGVPMQSHSQKKLSPIPGFQRKNVSCYNSPFMNNTDESNDSERELCIVEDVASEHSNENGLNPSASGKQHANDSEINDLASVSSVIDTANSQDICKFLNPVTFSKTHSSAASELGSLSLVSKTDTYKNSNELKKKYPCNQCNKSFDTTSALTRHMVIHTGQKKHKCSTCGKAFGTKSNCKRHELTHVPKNAQKPKHPTSEFQNTSDTSNNNTELSNFSLTTDQTDKLNHTSEFHQNSSGSSGTGPIIPTSNTLATFSHLFSGNYCSTQNLVCEYCLNTYKNFTDLSNHMRELHPSEYKHGVRRFS